MSETTVEPGEQEPGGSNATEPAAPAGEPPQEEPPRPPDGFEPV